MRQSGRLATARVRDVHITLRPGSTAEVRFGYVTPDDEHAGRGHQIRRARRDGLARAARLAHHRNPDNRNQP